MNVLLLLKTKDTLAYLYDTNTVRQGLEKMKARGFTAIPVITKKGEYVGSVSEGDFLRHLMDCGSLDLKAQEEHSILDIMRPDWNPAVRVSVEMDGLLERAMSQNFVPVVDDRNLFIGIVTRRDIIAYFVNKDRDK